MKLALCLSALASPIVNLPDERTAVSPLGPFQRVAKAAGSGGLSAKNGWAAIRVLLFGGQSDPRRPHFLIQSVDRHLRGRPVCCRAQNFAARMPFLDYTHFSGREGTELSVWQRRRLTGGILAASEHAWRTRAGEGTRGKPKLRRVNRGAR